MVERKISTVDTSENDEALRSTSLIEQFNLEKDILSIEATI